MQPDGSAAGPGTQLDQVAELVDGPQPVTVVGLGGGTAAADQWITDLAAVLDLADDLRPPGC